MVVSSSSSTYKWKYDVFLSFRGEDTRGGFTDHLYEALKQKGIYTFRDEEELEEGEDISSNLVDAIEASRIALVVVSENYATSRWCLDELVKIFECEEKFGMSVLPIFYKVDPSNVRKQKGSFGEAFVRHEEIFRGNESFKLKKWREVLTKLADLKAWLSQPWSHESKVIEEITAKIWKRIKPSLTLTNEDQLVGINWKLDKLSSLLIPKDSDDVIFVGIHGMGGIGKTTIARVLYERIRDEFEAHCFLSDVREKSETSGIPNLQSKLLSRMFSMKNNDIWDVEEGIVMINKAFCKKKSLLVLDDVDHFDQLIGLIPNKTSFGNGSRVIITTRNSDLLLFSNNNEFEVITRIFEMEELQKNEALELLNMNAFMKTCPKDVVECYIEHSKSIVKLVGGHPLALKLLGLCLRNKDLRVWNCVIQELQGDHHHHHENTNNIIMDQKIFKCLKVSYDGLDELEKEIFLDVACFFKGKGRELIEEILNGCHFYAQRRIDLLIQKSLLTLSYDNKLQMHDLLQEMGRKIVRDKLIQDRLWCHKDVKSVIKEELIQSIFFKSTRNIVEFPIQFSRMHQLRLLNFHNVRLKNQLEYCIIPSELRYLKWKGYPLEILPLSADSEEYYKLIRIHMCHSNLKQFWHGEKHLEELKYIKLNHSEKLSKTPNFAKVPNLKRLELEGCTSLVNIHPSIFTAQNLIFLSLKDCINLTNLPSQINIKVLEVLILSGCSKVKKIPQFSGNTNKLLQLHLDATSISNLPSSIATLNHLAILSLQNCKKLTNIFNLIHKMTSLQTLNLSGCSNLECRRKRKADKDDELGIRKRRKSSSSDTTEVLAEYSMFKRLFLWLYKTPASDGIVTSLAGLYSLTRLNLRDCNLESIPDGIECLVSLVHLNLSGNHFTHLPTTISRLHNLRRLNINQCKKLEHFPELPPRLLRLMSKDCTSLKNFLDISKLGHSYFMIEMNLLNCYNLVDNNKDIYTLITSWMQRMLFRKGTFNIMIPGSEIPDWFTNTNVGSSICIDWNPNAWNASRILFALCVVCGPSNYDRQDRGTVVDVPFAIIASVTGKDEQNLSDGDLIVNGFPISGMRRKLDHIWMFVLPRTTSLRRKIQNYKKIQFRFLLQNNYGNQYSANSNVELKKCGVAFINNEEDQKEAMKRYASYIILMNKNMIN